MHNQALKYKLTVNAKVPENFDRAENVEKQKKVLLTLLGGDGDIPPVFCLIAKKRKKGMNVLRCNIFIEKLSEEQKQEIKTTPIFKNSDFNYCTEIQDEKKESIAVFLSATGEELYNSIMEFIDEDIDKGGYKLCLVKPYEEDFEEEKDEEQ